MDMKTVFLRAVGIAVAVLVVMAVVLIVLVRLYGVLPYETGISFFSLSIDIAVGVFTIWGLYWAASEFAGAQAKPDLHLVIGKESEDQEGTAPLKSEADALIGRDTVSQHFPVSSVTAGLFLENTQPKAARYVQVVLRVLSVPCPESVEIGDYHGGLANARKQDRALSLSFGEDLVVYKGEMAYLTSIKVTWPRSTHPERITFVAKLCSLEGEPKEVTVSHPILWIEKAT